MLVAVLAGVAGLATVGLGRSTHAQLGPGQVELRAKWSRDGRTQLGLPPLGAISAVTHDTPLAVDVRVEELDMERVQELLGRPDAETWLRRSLSSDIEPLVRRFARQAVLTSLVVGILVGAVLPGRRWSWLVAGAAGGVVAVSALLAQTWSTYDEEAFRNPRFEGSLQRAPEILRSVQKHVEGFDDIRGRVGILSQQVANLYRATVLSPEGGEDDVSILHVSDIHLNPLAVEVVRQLASQFQVDAVLDTGDLTSFGFPLEARIGNLIAGIPVPYYLTPGNHDSDEVREALAAVPNVTVLAGSVVDIGGVRVLGVADPTFTADNRVGTAEATAEKRRQASVVGRLVAAQRPDVLALHDPVLAEAAAGSVPLVVAGHGHERSNDERDGTRFLTVGSTGATGLGSFTVATQLDYEAEVLHFSGGRLVAVDYVSLGGIGGSFRIDRTVIQPTERPGPDPTTNGEPGAVSDERPDGTEGTG
ncbi:MAG: metallophosphoesterase family protein [Actinomycetota bacterium]|nr:metallophosphoesterase family protein [Actinomycetota bacterium]